PSSAHRLRRARPRCLLSAARSKARAATIRAHCGRAAVCIAWVWIAWVWIARPPMRNVRRARRLERWPRIAAVPARSVRVSGDGRGRCVWGRGVGADDLIERLAGVDHAEFAACALFERRQSGLEIRDFRAELPIAIRLLAIRRALQLQRGFEPGNFMQ